MRVALRVDPDWHTSLAIGLTKRLKTAFGAEVVITTGKIAALPSSLKLLLHFERLIYRIPAIAPLSKSDCSTGSFDLIIDFLHDGSSEASSHGTLRVFYDGDHDERKFASLLSSRVPLIEITDGEGCVIAFGTPCTDNAESLAQAVDYVHARVITLIMKAIEQPFQSSKLQGQPCAMPSPFAIVGAQTRSLAHAVIRRLYHLCCFAPHWRVGWRFNEGLGVAERADLNGPTWRVIADPGNRFYADPMPIQIDGRSYIFFEDFPHATQRGVISFVEVCTAGPVGPVRPVLEEDWHLSYPFLVVDEGQVFMIPESSNNREVVLYKSAPFPTRWIRHATLLSDICLSDATVLKHNNLFWMFGTTHDGLGSPSDTLCIFWAEKLVGPWHPHPLNPILLDGVGARPAGPCTQFGGKIWRVTQDCSSGYGRAIGLVEIEKLDAHHYQQRLHSIIGPQAAWPGRRFHTLARSGTLECIDGSASAPRSKLVSKLFFPDRCGSHTGEPRV